MHECQVNPSIFVQVCVMTSHSIWNSFDLIHCVSLALPLGTRSGSSREHRSSLPVVCSMYDIHLHTQVKRIQWMFVCGYRYMYTQWPATINWVTNMHTRPMNLLIVFSISYIIILILSWYYHYVNIIVMYELRRWVIYRVWHRLHSILCDTTEHMH